MPQSKPTIDDYVAAILVRDRGIPYSDVMERHGITPNQFARAVSKDLLDLIRFSEGRTRGILQEIDADVVRRIELFRMEEVFLEQQYLIVNRKISGKQRKIYNGTYKHPHNVEYLVYFALIYNNPQLVSSDRVEVLQVIQNLPRNLEDYLYSIGLSGLMTNAFGKGEENSPLAVLRAFDRAYQRKTGNASLFDLAQKEHLHEWGNGRYAPTSYWQNTVNVEEAVYHTLIENNRLLASDDRAVVIEGIKNFSRNLQDYLHSIGLSGLMMNGFEKGEKDSPLAVLKAFDRAYQRKTGNVSLFDLTQEEHLHEWGDNFKAPKSYWQNPRNVEEAVYHTLTENNPQLASMNRKEVVQGIKNLPIDLQVYLHGIGLSGLMTEAFGKGEEGSPLAVLRAFDRAYQRKTGNASLFDLTQEEHLHEWGDNFKAPKSYWQNLINVENAVYHTLTENNPQLASMNRKEVVQGIKNLPRDLTVYLYSIGLSGLMSHGFEKGEENSPLAVLRAFDRAYQRKTGNASLFDPNQTNYLGFDNRNRLVR